MASRIFANKPHERRRPKSAGIAFHGSRRAVQSPTLHPMFQLQRTIGNRSIQRLLMIRRQPSPALLTPTAASAAVTDVRGRYDEDSIRTLESFSAQTPNGVFDAADAEALARLQRALGVTPNGKADVATLNAMLGVLGPTVGQRNAMIHLIVDHANIDTSAALGVVFDAATTTASGIKTLPGGISTILIGNPGFASYNGMVTAIRTQLGVRPAASATTAVAPTVLTSPLMQQAALFANAQLIKDVRSIKLLQGALGSRPTGRWDVELVRHIAARQQTASLLPLGTLDEPTLAAIAADMIANGSQMGVVQLIIEYYHLDRSHTLSIVFDPNPPNATAEAETVSFGSGMGLPGVVRLFPRAFSQPFAGLVHTLAHELGHVQQVIQGIANLDVREFLSEVIEIESKGMPPESLESDADIALMIQGRQPVHPGFLQDAQRMLHHWGRMNQAEKTTHHQRYRDLRSIIVNRINNEGSSSQKTTLAPFVQRLANADNGVP